MECEEFKLLKAHLFDVLYCCVHGVFLRFHLGKLADPETDLLRGVQ